jgi:hypothetical protein
MHRNGWASSPKCAQGDWLFPEVSSTKAANAWSNWWGRYLEKLGLAGQRKGLHSLRHCLKDALRAAAVPEDLNDALTGHSNYSVGRSYGARARHPSQRHKVIVERYGMPRLARTGRGHQRSAVPHHKLRGTALAAVGRNACQPQGFYPLSPYLGCRRLTLLAEGGPTGFRPSLLKWSGGITEVGLRTQRLFSNAAIFRCCPNGSAGVLFAGRSRWTQWPPMAWADPCV